MMTQHDPENNQHKQTPSLIQLWIETWSLSERQTKHLTMTQLDSENKGHQQTSCLFQLLTGTWFS